MEANDMREMREALVKIRDMIMGGGFDGRSPAYIVNICDSALAAPPRQCDVGTAEEQAKRFNDFCSTHICNKCVVHDKMAHSFNDGILERAFSCRLVFSQMPYEAEEGVRK